MAKELQDIDLKKEAPTLAGIPKKLPMKAPEGYFDSLTDTIMDKLPPVEESRAPGASNGPEWLNYAAIGLILVLFSIGLLFKMNQTNPSTADLTQLEELSSDELIAYLDGDDLDSKFIAEMVDPKGFSFETPDESFQESADEYLDDEIYLWDDTDFEDIDPELLKEMLNDNEI